MKRLTRWKITSPFLRCPNCGVVSRFVMVGRWKRQTKDGREDVRVPSAPVPAVPEEPEGGEDADG